MTLIKTLDTLIHYLSIKIYTTYSRSVMRFIINNFIDMKMSNRVTFKVYIPIFHCINYPIRGKDGQSLDLPLLEEWLFNL